jgi:hypothetical protein
MGRPSEWVKGFSGRAALKSPGAPSHRREIQQLFWLAIARGLTSEAAAAPLGQALCSDHGSSAKVVACQQLT